MKYNWLWFNILYLVHGEKFDSLHKLGCSHIQIIEQIDLQCALSAFQAWCLHSSFSSSRACIMWGPCQIQNFHLSFYRKCFHGFPWKVSWEYIVHSANQHSEISLQIELQIDWTLSGQSLQKTTAEHYAGLHCLFDESICVWLLFSYDILHQHVSLSFHDHFTMSSTSCNQISFPFPSM